MDKQKEMSLFLDWKKTKEPKYKQELIKSLTPLINGQVNKFVNSGIPKSAIELEGIRLTSKALSTYDPNLSQLNTHVTNNLRKLSRFVTDYQNIGHIPEPRALMIGQYRAVFDNLKEEKGREPTSEEIADEMMVSIREVERLQSELRNDLYLGTISEGEDDVGFYDFIDPTMQDSPKKEATEFVYFDATPEEKRILEAYTGIHGKPKKKAKDLMNELNINEATLLKIRRELGQRVKELL